MTIAVMGCVRELPSEFPLLFTENAGNMIHGNAPFEMFPDVVHSTDYGAIRASGSRNFVEFINKHCSHLILTLANTLKLNAEEGAHFGRTLQFLEAIEKPVVVFGLGVQSETDDLSTASLPSQAVALMKHISDRSPVVGVRGSFTAEVLSRLCGVQNTAVTGCPSLFSRPGALAQLPSALKAIAGRPAFNGTKFHRALERKALHNAIRLGHFLVEPVNKFNHGFYVEASQGKTDVSIPYFLTSYDTGNVDGDPRIELAARFRQNYRLFRSPASWYAFNAESVSYTYGTRFHVNMASILSGKPALWVTHDSRTRELVKSLKLPNVSEEKFGEMDPAEIPSALDYEPFFDGVGSLFKSFNSYLEAHELPSINSVSLARR